MKLTGIWRFEMAFVGLVLAAVVLVTHGGLIEGLGALAVLLTFGHTQIADRLAEQEASRSEVTVDCHRKLVWYLVGKEATWALYFVLHRSWSALVGVAVFLAYPVWRKFWRRRRPIS